MIAIEWKISFRNQKHTQYGKQANNEEYKISLSQTLPSISRTSISKYILLIHLEMVAEREEILTKSFICLSNILKTILYGQVNQTSFSLK